MLSVEAVVDGDVRVVKARELKVVGMERPMITDGIEAETAWAIAGG